MSERRQVVFWHRELPPVDANPLDEHVVEAESHQVAGTISHRDELWSECYESLMAQARVRLEQEVARLGGDYAHVLGESLDVKRNDSLGVAWLHGIFTYVILRSARR